MDGEEAVQFNQGLKKYLAKPLRLLVNQPSETRGLRKFIWTIRNLIVTNP
jgi:hypothetical protein